MIYRLQTMTYQDGLTNGAKCRNWYQVLKTQLTTTKHKPSWSDFNFNPICCWPNHNQQFLDNLHDVSLCAWIKNQNWCYMHLDALSLTQCSRHTMLFRSKWCMAETQSRWDYLIKSLEVHDISLPYQLLADIRDFFIYNNRYWTFNYALSSLYMWITFSFIQRSIKVHF